MIYKKKIFSEIAFDDEHNKINTHLGEFPICVTCDTLKTCLSKFNKESKLKRDQNSNFYNIYNVGKK